LILAQLGAAIEDRFGTATDEGQTRIYLALLSAGVAPDAFPTGPGETLDM
jgi:hypothetical protein